MNSQDYRAVIFDLDGTLLDTLEDIANAANLVLASRGFPTRSLEVHRAAIGNGARQLMFSVLPESNRDPVMVQECFVAFRKEYGERWNVRTRPYAGIPEMLDAVQVLGLKMAVLSNKPAEFTRKCVSDLLSWWHFEAVVGAEDHVPSKPDPAGALEIARRLAFPPNEFLYLGDTGVDMKTANGAGMFAVGALCGFRGREELLRDGAKVLLENPMEMLNLLQKSLGNH